MRKTLMLLGALVLAASPAAAQQSGPSAPVDPPVAAMERTAPAAQPSLFPTTEQVRAQVSANEETHANRKAMGQNDFLYLVAAIAVGVIIAAVILG